MVTVKCLGFTKPVLIRDFSALSVKARALLRALMYSVLRAFENSACFPRVSQG
jgi:hypothetical protein